MYQRRYMMFVAMVSISLLVGTGVLAQDATPEVTPEGYQLFELNEAGMPVLDAPEATQAWTIGWAMNAAGYPFSVAMQNGVDMAVEDMGVELLFVDGRGETQTQIAQMEDFITQGVDGIVLVAWDATAVVPQVEAAAAAGIPVVTCFNDLGGAPVENYPGSVSLVGVDEVEAGRQVAREILAQLPDGGQVAIIEGAAGFQAAIDRTTGFIEVLSENPAIEVVVSQPGDWTREKGLQVAENMLLAYPEIDVIYAHDDSTALGAIDAVKNAERLDQVRVFGIGGSIPGLEAVSAGEMAGTVFYSPTSAGYLCTKALVAYLEGEALSDYILMPSPVVTSENISEFTPEW